MQGVEAVTVLLEATPDTPSYMIGMHENKIIRVPLVDAVQQVRSVLSQCSRVIEAIRKDKKCCDGHQ